MQGFDIVGRDLLSVVTRKDTGPWGDSTDAEWEFNPRATAAKDTFSVRSRSPDTTP